jgi:hypothetical protein
MIEPPPESVRVLLRRLHGRVVPQPCCKAATDAGVNTAFDLILFGLPVDVTVGEKLSVK